MPSHRRTSPVVWILVIGSIVIMLLWVVFPFYWALINSVKHQRDIFTPGSWLPWLTFQPTLETWYSNLGQREIRRALYNSTMIAVGAATLSTALGTLAAYALARFRFQKMSNSTLTTWFLSQRILPPVVVVLPFFLLMSSINATDTVWSLILLNAVFTLPFPVILLSQMFRELPYELEEAAYVDGASRYQAFFRIALPLVMPGLVAVWIICLAFAWNEFLFALTLTSKNAIPMPVIIAGAQHTRGVQFHEVGVRVLLTMLPPTILALLAQRYIVRGLTLGAVKG